MTIYEKLAEARVKFQESNIKMTGENAFAKYKYFELSDILPHINRIGKELGFVCLVSFSDELALLTVRDSQGDGEIVFTSPMSTASLKGCHEVQNLGAVQTYIKRYLYQNAFEIVENDALNGTHDPNAKTEPAGKKPKIATEAEKHFNSVANALLEYLEVGTFEHPENVEKVIADKNLAGMEKALAVAKEKEAQNG